MASTANYLDPRVLSDLQGLTLRTRHIVDGFMSGTHRSANRGSSTEYSHHRPYVPGDDLRHVDWKAFGRTDRFYVKQFMDETNLACTFLLDASNSMQYQGPHSPLSKLEYAGCLVSSLAWLVRSQGDAIGLSIFLDAQGIDIPAAANDQQLAEIIQAMESVHGFGDVDMAVSIRKWALRTNRRQLVVIVSDLFSDETVLRNSLTDLRQFGHEVIVFRICDRDEIEFPFHRYTEFQTMESGDNLALDAGIFRDGYLSKFRQFQSRLQKICLQSEIDLVPLVSDESLGPALGNFLAMRSRPESSRPDTNV